MVDDLMAEDAYVAFKMIIGDLAARAMEFGEDASPPTALLKIDELQAIGDIGRDIALAADATAMALRRAYHHET